MKKLKSIIAAAVCVSLAACSAATGFSGNEILSDSVKRDKDVSVTYNYADGCREAPTAYNSFANTVTGFSLKLLRKSYDGKAMSIAPFSAAAQLGLLANGAKGDTRAAILLALGGELDLDSFNICCSYFKSRMENVGKIARAQETGNKDENKTLTLDGALFINDKTDVRSSFLQANADFYGDDIIRYDFSAGADKLEEYTDGKMTLSGDENMASYCTLSLSDLWLNQSLSCEEIPMQSQRARGIMKYTVNNPLKALFIMPDGDFEQYVKSFDSAEYSKLLESVDYTKRQDAVIPSFQTEAQSDDLAPVLEKAGLNITSGKDSDFGNLTHGGEPSLDEFRCSVPSLSAGNTGIASAATADSAGNSEKSGDAWIFDKPFIFILADNETDIPVYISTVE